MKSYVWVLQFFVIIVTVSTDDYSSDMDDTHGSSTRNYSPMKSSSSSSSTLSNGVEANPGYAESPLNIPTVPSLPPPPGRESTG